jgi:geranylgeranyl pyrophosphate synthase
MRKTKGTHETQSENLQEQAKRITVEEGKKGWNLAKETLLSHGTSIPKLREAINYIMMEYKPDFFRPAVVSLCCQALGGTPEITVPSSASLVLLGRAIGIHDDIIDKMKVRNRHQTLFGKFGEEIALIVSDILLFEGFTLMRKNSELVPEQNMAKILETIERIWFEQSEGEVLEVESRRQLNTTPEDCLAKIKMRASELEAIARISGILASGSQEEINVLGNWGRSLGTMSLLRDEMIDMLETDVLRHRIRNESLPLPLIYATQKPEAKSKITSLISRSKMATADLWMVSRTSYEAGGMNYVADLIAKTAKEAESQISLLRNKRKELSILTTVVVMNPEDWEQIMRSKLPSSKKLSKEL